VAWLERCLDRDTRDDAAHKRHPRAPNGDDGALDSNGATQHRRKPLPVKMRRRQSRVEGSNLLDAYVLGKVGASNVTPNLDASEWYKINASGTPTHRLRDWC